MNPVYPVPVIQFFLIQLIDPTKPNLLNQFNPVRNLIWGRTEKGLESKGDETPGPGQVDV